MDTSSSGAAASDVTGTAAAADILGGPDVTLDAEHVRDFVTTRLQGADLTGRSVAVIVPDATRSCPLPLLLGAVHDALHGRASRITVVIALGTHAAMSDTEIERHLGVAPGGLADRYPGATIVNHEWWDPATFETLGTIGADRLAELSGGLLRREIEVKINRVVVDHDVTLILGPVFPHEVVGFSGAPSTCSRGSQARRSSTSRIGSAR